MTIVYPTQWAISLDNVLFVQSLLSDLPIN